MWALIYVRNTLRPRSSYSARSGRKCELGRNCITKIAAPYGATCCVACSAAHVLRMSLRVPDHVFRFGCFLCRRPLISRQESFRPEVPITVVLALPNPFLNTQARTHTSSPTLLMCPLGLQWLRHKDSQPTDSHRTQTALL